MNDKSRAAREKWAWDMHLRPVRVAKLPDYAKKNSCFIAVGTRKHRTPRLYLYEIKARPIILFVYLWTDRKVITPFTDVEIVTEILNNTEIAQCREYLRQKYGDKPE